MNRIVVDYYSYKYFFKSNLVEDVTPNHWPYVVHELSRFLFNKEVSRWKFSSIFSSSDILFSWIPSPELALCSLFEKQYIYLCWGGLGRSGLKGFLEKRILKNASILLVNDPTTQKEIYTISGRRSTLVPYCVDTSFFSFGDISKRKNYFFCCSTNDRNPKILLDLAIAGHKIIWSTHAHIAKYWQGRHSNLQVLTNLSWVDLATHYRNCAAFILPLVGDSHAAGQTTMLEAISCGAPVFVSSSRASKIFSHLPSVFVVSSDSWIDWSSAITKSSKSVDFNSACLISRKYIEDNNSIYSCISSLTSTISSALNEK